MKEMIISITEFFDKTWYSDYEKKHVVFDGFEILTNRQKIILAVGNEQQCCEDVGYFMTNDNLEDFLDSSLESIDYVDGNLKVHEVAITISNQLDNFNHTYSKYFIDNKREIELNAKDNYALFVNFHTSKGKLQFVAYNAGNGYYGHAFELISEQVTHSTSI